jgi:2'-5' RNA ligase
MLPVNGYRPAPRQLASSVSASHASGRAADSISTSTPGGGGFQPMWNPQSGMGGERDPLSAELLHVYFDQPTREQIGNLLRVSGLSSRIIGIPPAWCTLHGDESWSVQDNSRATTPHLAAMSRLGLASKFAAADFAGRKGGDAALWVQVEELGVWNELGQRNPLNLATVTKIRRLEVVRRHELRPGRAHSTWDDGDLSFGETETWTIRMLRNGVSGSWVVHSSRLIFFHGTELDPDEPNRPEGWGNDPAITAVLNAIMTNARITRGMNRVGDNLFRTIIKTFFPEAGTPAEFMSLLQERWSLFRFMGHLGAMLIAKGGKDDPGEEVVQLNAPISGIADLIDVTADIAAMHTGFPKPLIKGDVAGALGGSGQAQSWQASFAGLIHSRQVNYYNPRLRKVYDIQYATVGILEPDYTLQFAPVILPTGLEEAEERLRLLEGDQIGLEMHALHPGQIARTRFAGKMQRQMAPPLASEVPVGLEGSESVASYGAGVAGSGSSASGAPKITSLRQIAGPAPETEEEWDLEGSEEAEEVLVDLFGDNEAVTSTEAASTDATERYTVPAGARSNARQVLRWRDAHGEEVAGMTATGWRRARQLATSRTISREDVVTIAAWFARHGATPSTFRVAAEFSETPWKDAGYVSLLGWGGKTMAAWAKARRAAMDVEEAATEDAGDAALVRRSGDTSGRPDPSAQALQARERSGDADWTRKAYLYAEVPNNDAFLSIQAAALELAPLEGYATGDPPPSSGHVTLLYYGKQAAADLPELAARAASCLPDKALPLRPLTVTLFPAGPDGRMPVVVELDPDPMAETHDALVRCNARLLATDLHPEFRPHVTLGFLDPDDVDVIDALRELSVPRTFGKAETLYLDYAGERVVDLSLVGEAAELGPALDEALGALVVEHNSRVRNLKTKRATLAMLRSVMARALAEAKDAPGPENFGRVRAFLYLLRNGRPKVVGYTADNDLLPVGHPKRI